MRARDGKSSVKLDVSVGEQRPARVLEPDAPFRILVLGDFSGRSNRRLTASLGGRRPVLVDCDNFDEVLRAMEPELQLPGSSLRFKELDDFHPDQICRRVELFQKLADLRDNPPRPAASQRQAAAPSARGLLDDMMKEAEERSVRPAADAADNLAAFIERAMAPHLEQKPTAAGQQWTARVDAAVNEQLRNILHHPDFQALEAAWRAVSMLVLGLGAEEGLQIYLFDTTLPELLGDPEAAAQLIGASRNPWSLLVGNFAFGQSETDAAALSFLAGVAAEAGAPFLAEAQPAAGSEDPYWHELRHSAEARWIGLALPRFLLRLPYGAATSPVESLNFEEMIGSDHGRYLWGNPAFCCAYLIGQAFRSHGSDMRPGIHRRMDGLPLHVYRADGESITKPCAEVLLTEHEAEELLDGGFMPLASVKDQDAVVLVQFRSIADPPAPLAGRW